MDEVAILGLLLPCLCFPRICGALSTVNALDSIDGPRAISPFAQGLRPTANLGVRSVAVMLAADLAVAVGRMSMIEPSDRPS